MEAGDQQPASFIDRIVINVTNFPVGKTLFNQSFVGIFGNAEIYATIALACTVDFQGPTCDIFCNNNCDTCQPGFTGQFCATDINYCAAGFTCGQNQRCVDGILNYTCVCDGNQNCNTDATPCAEVVCQNNGECFDEEGSFTCNCPPGFTGERCEKSMDENSGSSGNSIIAVSAIIAAVVFSTLVVAVIAAIACLLCVKKRNSAGNTAKMTAEVPGIHPLSSPLPTIPNPPVATSMPDEYDYPFLDGPLQGEENYNLERCHTYSTIDSTPRCNANPAYALADLRNGVDEDSHIYY